MFKSISSKVAEQQRSSNMRVSQQITALDKKQEAAYRDLQKEILRLQILEGIDSKRLSKSEVEYFYDKYKSFGGNSFVSGAVRDYVNKLEDKKHE